MFTLARMVVGDILVARDKIGLDPLIVIRQNESGSSPKIILAQCSSAAEILTNCKMTTSNRKANAALSALINQETPQEEIFVEIWGLSTKVGPQDVVLNWQGLHDVLMAAPCFIGSDKSMKQVLETLFPEIKTTLPKLHNYLNDKANIWNDAGRWGNIADFCENDNAPLISGKINSPIQNPLVGTNSLKITKPCQKYFKEAS